MDWATLIGRGRGPGKVVNIDFLVQVFSDGPEVSPMAAVEGALDEEWEALCHGYNKRTTAVQISASECLQLQQEGKLLILDTRGHDEHAFSCIPGARMLSPTPFGMALCLTVGSGMFYEQDIPDLAAVPAGTTIVCACTAGLRSGFCAVDLSSKCGRTVKNLHGGIIAWVNSGGVVVDPVSGEPRDKVHTYGQKWSKYVKGDRAFF